MPKRTEDQIRLNKLIEKQQANYKDIIDNLHFKEALLSDVDRTKSLLRIIDTLECRNADFVIIPSVKKNLLNKFEYKYKYAPFYILSLDAPEISYEFSEMTNTLTEVLRRQTVKGKRLLPHLLKGAQHKAMDFNKQLQKNIEAIQADGFVKPTDIVIQLNSRGIKTRRGEDWGYQNFQRAMKQISKLKS